MRPVKARPRRKKLVMTLLVRDEVDIVERNLLHHFNSGVDFIVATDNGSVDGTREVLLRYQEQGRLHLIDEPAQDMDQARWVNRMGRLAYEEFGAEAIFHCDADEFWYALSGDLTAEISRGLEHAYTAHSFSVNLADRGGRETIDDAVWVAFEALEKAGDPADPSARVSYKRKRRLKASLGKVMTSTRDGYLDVAIGNHILASGEPVKWSRDLYLLHYPVRSFAQFAQKVVNGGAAVARNPNIAPRDALHWREWYAHYLAGTLEEDYKALLIRDPEWYVRQGVLCDRRALTDEEFAAVVADAIRRRNRRPPLEGPGSEVCSRPGPVGANGRGPLMTTRPETRTRLIFIGGGRLAGLLYATCHRQYEVLGYVDDVHAEAYLTTTYGIPCLGTSGALPTLKAEGVAAVVAITDASARKKYGELLDSLDFPLATLVFPTAVVDDHATIEPGCIIRHQAVIGPQVRLGRNCVVSDNAYVAHDSVIGAHTYISPGVNINGSVTIGEASFLGTGAVVIPERRIGDGCMVGAAACVTKDVPDGQTVVGVPARPVADGETASAPEGAAPSPAAERCDPAPLVSVLMSSYNHGRFIGEAIRSSLGQTVTDLELIIVDDASTDDSVAVIEQFTDPRIRFVWHERNRGIGVTKNEVFAMARGQYVAVLNSDDAWLPDKLERQLAVFAEDPGLGAVFTGAQVIDESGEPFRDEKHFYFSIFDQPNRSRAEWLSYFFYQGNCLCAPSVLMPRERVLEVGYHDKRLRQLGDLDLWVRVCMRYPIWIHPERLTRFRVLRSGANTSAGGMPARVAGRWEYSRILRHYLEIPSEVELLAILPEAERFVDPAAPLDASGIAYTVAHLALESPDRHRQLFALETLFELMADDEAALCLERRFRFGYKDLTDLAGRLDVFGSADARGPTHRIRHRLPGRKERRTT